jgi:hypothetical protein
MIDSTNAIEFISAAGSGRTSPAITLCEGKGDDDLELFCKLSDKCEEGVVHLAREAIAACLAADLGLPIPKPYYVEVTDEFIETVIDPAMRQRFKESCKVGFGSTKVPEQFSSWPTASRAAPNMIDKVAEIFLFDGIIQNGDRRVSNPNCLVRGDDLRLIDHDLCFTHKQLIVWTPPWQTGGMELLKQTGPDQHVFYTSLAGKSPSFSRIKSAWSALSDTHINGYQSAIPPEWSAANAAVATAVDLIKDARDHIDDCIAEARRVIV